MIKYGDTSFLPDSTEYSWVHIDYPFNEGKVEAVYREMSSVTAKNKNKKSTLEYTLFDIFHNIYLLSILVLGESLPGGTKHPSHILKLNSFIERDRKKKEMEMLNLPSLHVWCGH